MARMFSESRPLFQQLFSLFSPLVPADQPVEGLAGELIEQQVQIQEQPALIGGQVADIPAPALVGAADLFAHRGQ